MENTLATLMLAAWVPFCVALFAVVRPQVAATLGLMIGMMVLPELVAFDFPGVPPLDKQLLSTVGVAVGSLFFATDRVLLARPGVGPESIVVLSIAGAFGTALTNPDPIVWGPLYLEGLTSWDAMSMGIRDLLFLAVPFFVGRALFSRASHLRILLVSLACGGLAYSILALWEIRMAPTLHEDIYGFAQHSFLQTIRFGGFRPMIFMSHGLMTCLFLMLSGLALFALWRSRTTLFGVPTAPLAMYAAGIVVLAKSTGAILYAALFYPLVLLASPRIVATVSVVVCAVVLSYPLIRAMDLIPTDALIEGARAIGEERAHSLNSRFATEDAQLERIHQKPMFGWGTSGRDRVYDVRTGRDITITDGYWVFLMGTRGYLGFFPVFLLMVVSAIPARKAVMVLRSARSRICLAALSLVVALYCLDLLPNAFLPAFTPFLGGALWGLAKGMPAEERMRIRARARREASAIEMHPAPAPA